MHENPQSNYPLLGILIIKRCDPYEISYPNQKTNVAIIADYTHVDRLLGIAVSLIQNLKDVPLLERIVDEGVRRSRFPVKGEKRKSGARDDSRACSLENERSNRYKKKRKKNQRVHRKEKKREEEIFKGEKKKKKKKKESHILYEAQGAELYIAVIGEGV